jgi:hypothetical protein
VFMSINQKTHRMMPNDQAQAQPPEGDRDRSK